MLLRIIAVGMCVTTLALSAGHAQTTGQARQCVTFPPNVPPEAELRYLLSHPGVSVCPPSNPDAAGQARSLQRSLTQGTLNTIGPLRSVSPPASPSTPPSAPQVPQTAITRQFYQLAPFCRRMIFRRISQLMASLPLRKKLCRAPLLAIVLFAKRSLASLPPSSLASVPTQQQMVTVWPVDSMTVPEQLKRANPDCDVAISHYDLPTALTALKEARTQQHSEFLGQGPYLLGWAPSSTKGQKDALVLVVDLSNARTSAELVERFKFWREQIEQKPELWRRGWDKPGVLALIRNWADRWGTMIFFFGPAKAKDE